MRLSFKMHGVKEFKAKLGDGGGGGGILTRLKNLSPLYKTWGIETLKWIDENYMTGGGKVGGWKRLKGSTLMSRRGKRKGGKLVGYMAVKRRPLLDTGELLKNQWNQSVKSWGTAIGHPAADIVEYHEKGTKGPYPIEPVKRKFLWFGVTPADRRRGQQLGGHAQHRIVSKPYKQWGKGKTPGIFVKKVEHPGLPARRQLPEEHEIAPILIRATDIFIQKAIK